MRKLLLLIWVIGVGLSLYAAPTASFTATPASGCAPLLVSFTDLSSSTGTITRRVWYFGDGDSLLTSLTAVSHIYSSAGTFCPYLKITDNTGATDSMILSPCIEVYAKPDVSISFVGSTSGCVPYTVCIRNSSVANCGSFASCSFDMGDGTVISSCDTLICHTYTTAGVYDVSAYISNSCGCSQVLTLNDTVHIQASPTANFTASPVFSCSSPLNVTFNNTSSGAVSYQWDFENDGTIDATTTSPTHNYTSGTYTVRLIATSALGCTDTFIRTDYISVSNPIADFTQSRDSICQGTSISFTNTSTAGYTSSAWQFTGPATINSSATNPSITFSTPGTYNVRLIVNYSGCADTILRTAVVHVLANPTASFTASPINGCTAPLNVTYTNTSTAGSTYTWSFPGGSPSTFSGSPPPVVSYSASSSGAHLTVTSPFGCSATYTGPAININALNAQFRVNDSSGCAPLAITFTNTTSLPSGITLDSLYWFFGDLASSSSTATSPTFNYPDTGCFTPTMVITTTSGCRDTVSYPDLICVGVTPTAPCVDVSPDTVCYEEEENCFSAGCTNANQFLWSFGDGSPPLLTDSGNICYTYQDLGDFIPSVIPLYNGCPGLPLNITPGVTIEGPATDFSDSLYCPQSLTAYFKDRTTDADSLYWDFGDPARSDDHSSALNPVWTYDSSGCYNVVLHTWNFTTGCEHEKTINVCRYLHTTSFTISDTTLCTGQDVTFTNTSNYIDQTWFKPNAAATWVDRGSSTIYTRNYTTPQIATISMVNLYPDGCRDTLVKSNAVIITQVAANFSPLSRVGCAPLNVNFNNTSSSTYTGIATNHWDFGLTYSTTDTSNLRNPSFTFDSSGVFAVRLTVVDSFGCSTSRTGTVISSNPKASFSVSDTLICSGLSLTVSPTYSVINARYSWIFTGATPATSSSATPGSIIYNTAGLYPIYLTVTDTGTCIVRDTAYVHVYDEEARFSVSDTYASCPPLLVNFYDSSIYDICAWSWDFGDGASSTSANPAHLYTVPGRYTVTLIAQTCDGCSDTLVSDSLIVIDGPVGSFNVVPTSLCVGDYSDFYLETENTRLIRFLYGDGQLDSINYSSVFAPGVIRYDTLMHNFAISGTYTPQMLLSDTTGCVVLIEPGIDITVDSIIPDFSYVQTASCDTAQVCFYDSSTLLYSSSASIASYKWYFGDGDSASITNPCHKYTSPGDYEVVLIVQASYGCADTTRDTIHVTASPIASFTLSDTSICAPDSVMFFNTSTAENNPLLVGWNFGVPASFSSVDSPTYVYSSPGIYNVVLTVTDSLGCVDSAVQAIQVYPTAYVTTNNDTNICFGDSLQLMASGASNYIWTPSTYLSDSSIQNPLSVPLDDINYIVNSLDTNGCLSVDTVVVNVQRVTANFRADSVCLGDTTHFTNLSTRTDFPITTYRWDFDDALTSPADTSLVTNPIFVYISSGIHAVNFRVTDSIGCVDDTTINVYTLETPVADFIADTVCYGDFTAFTDVSDAGGGVIATHFWDFGVSGISTDTSTLSAPYYSFPTMDTFRVTLTVTNGSCGDDTTKPIYLYSLPHARFLGDSTCVNNVVYYDDSSTAGSGTINQWQWNFGDGSTLADTSSAQNTSYNYGSIGTYNVNLIVFDDNGCFDDTTVRTTILNASQASFNADTICLGDTMHFSDLSLSFGGVIAQWKWYFDDPVSGMNDSSSLQNPSHFYTSTGLYAVRLVIGDNLACDDDTIINIFVAPNPIARFVSDTGCAGSVTSFFNFTDSLGEPMNGYQWQFGDASAISVLINPTHGYAMAGTYNAILTAQNIYGCTDDTTASVFVAEIPSPNFIADTVCEGLATHFTDLSTSADFPLLGWNYHFGNPGTDSSLLQNPSFVYESGGNYFVNLEVENSVGCKADTTIRVEVIRPPVANFSFSGPCEGAITRFTDVSTDGTEPINNWLWDFNEVPPATAGVPNPNHIFTSSGVFNVSLTVQGIFGCADDTIIPVSIYESPIPNFEVQDAVCLGLPICFKDSSVSTTAPVNSWNWDLENDGTIDFTVDSACYTFTTSGVKEIKLVVTNASGCSDSITKDVIIHALPIANFSFEIPCVFETFDFTNLSTPATVPIVQYDWDFGDGLSASTKDPSHIYGIVDTYDVQLTITDAYGCEDDTIQAVMVDYIPSIIPPADTTICEGNTVQLTVSGLYDYVEWTPDYQINNTNTDTVLVSPEYSFTYNVSGHTALGACNPATASVRVYVIPNLDFNVEALPTEIVLGSSSELTAIPESVIDSIVWTPAQTLSCDDCLDPTASPTTGTMYVATIYYTLSDAYCYNSDSIYINVLTSCPTENVFIPNTFTPNFDELNDVFYIRSQGEMTVEYFRIFDRWGNKVYEEENIPTNDAEHAWKGTNLYGKEVNSGVYVYVARVKCSNDESLDFKGNVSLFR